MCTQVALCYEQWARSQQYPDVVGVDVVVTVAVPELSENNSRFFICNKARGHDSAHSQVLSITTEKICDRYISQ